MARMELVSRELIGTTAEVLTVDLTNGSTGKESISLKGTYKTPEGLLKAIQRKMDTSEKKYLKVLKMEPVHKLYGMPVEKFFAEAFELDPATRKPLENH